MDGDAMTDGKLDDLSVEEVEVTYFRVGVCGLVG
jgi:hypothetical protein